MWGTEDRAAETAQVRELLFFCEMLAELVQTGPLTSFANGNIVASHRSSEYPECQSGYLYKEKQW